MKIQGFVILLLIIAFSDATAQADWELARDNEETKVWVKDFPDSDFKQFKAETIVDASMDQVIALQLDVANMGKWYDNVGTVTPVKKISDLEGVYIIDFDMPFPVRDRVSAVRAKLWYEADIQTVKIITQYEPGILEDTDKIHVKRIQSTWEISKMADGRVKILHSGYMDPSGFLPAWIGNTGVKDGPIKTFNAMREILPEYGDITIEWLSD